MEAIMKNYSYGEVVPQNLQDRLLAIRDSLSKSFWDIGDIALMICAYADDNEMMVSREFIWSAVGSFVGLSARTVRDYARVARFFDYETREQYDVLTFSHFALASRYPSNWRNILDFAIDEIDRIGRPATVDKLEVQFTFEGGNEYVQPVTYESPMPRGSFMHYVHSMRMEVERLAISEEYREEISDHLDAIERLLQLVTA